MKPKSGAMSAPSLIWPSLRQPGVLWAVVAAVAYWVAFVHSVISIDSARDLHYALTIAQDGARPLLGPPINSHQWLGPVWYYLLAGVVTVSPSLVATVAWLGLLAVTKFFLLWSVGLAWYDRRYAACLVAASVLPGLASYQLLGMGHVPLLDCTLWATAYFALRLVRAPHLRRHMIGLGVCIGLAVHAHPTAILVMPWALVAIAALPRPMWLRAFSVVSISALAFFLPAVFAYLGGESASLQSAAKSALDSGLTDNLASLRRMPEVALNLLWYQPKLMVETAVLRSAAAPMWWSAAWGPLWGTLMLVTVAGLGALALHRGRLRATALAATATMLGALVIVLISRGHTPFYMLYVCLPPLAVLLACAWRAIFEWRFLWPVHWLAPSTVLALHIIVCAGLVVAARTGLVQSRLPQHANFQVITEESQLQSVLAVPARDRLARWICKQPTRVSLHGDTAGPLDIGLQHEVILRCNAERVARIGGVDNAWVGLPRATWERLGIDGIVRLGALGFAPALTVVSPIAPMPAPDGLAYPPRLQDMLAAARRDWWAVEVTTPPSVVVVVSNLLATSTMFASTASINGMIEVPLLQLGNTYVFACPACVGTTQWRIAVKGGLPATTSITTVGPTPRSATLSP
jgi:hypothetical protein